MVFVLSFSGDEEAEASLLRELVMAEIKVTSFSRETASMEDVLIKLVSPLQEADAVTLQEIAEEQTHD
jgi:hypothetical protein